MPESERFAACVAEQALTVWWTCRGAAASANLVETPDLSRLFCDVSDAPLL